MEFEKVLYGRRSVRSFTSKPVTAPQVRALLDAAVHAPSACNMQSWYFYVVADRSVRDRFTKCLDWAKQAPVWFVVCTDGEEIVGRFGEKAERLFIYQDTAAAIENLLLRAHDLGLGGCWMGIFDEDECRAVLNIPEKRRVAAIIAVGEPAVETPARERRPVEAVSEIIGTLPGEADAGQSKVKEPPKPFELKSASLPRAVFDDLNLDRATFNNINMHGVKFTDINMTATFFGGLNLSGAYFGCVDLNDATFENPCFDGATFKNCSMKNVTFENCELDATVVTKDGKSVKLK